MKQPLRHHSLSLALLALGGCAAQGDRLQPFEAMLTAQDSATAALGQWCAARGIADPPVIRAIVDRAAQGPATSAIRAALGVGPAERVVYRHVRLACGATVLSVAQNWYVPARLTPDMNRTLESGDAPFGRVVAPLSFRRERIDARRGRADECPVGTVLSHRAVLRVGDGRAISLVVECYTAATLDRGKK